MIKLSPSILSANLSNLGKDIKDLEKFGADMVHIDVMDGRFVPNISFGMPIIKAVRGISNLIFDVHLMIEEPSKYIDEFAKSGADIITIHYESDIHIDRTIKYIKSLGKKAGIAINPATPVSVLECIIQELDMVLIMSVNPGFGGQSFIDYTLNKIKEIKLLSEKCNPSLMIEVDGGINKDNIKSIVKAGANVIVAGSSVFKNEEIEKNISILKEGI
ncbi:ribulose-phosphate 3-epimerase [Clostridium pasteurianum DSM 525 = ATCC 6013]|uniref:Ribulose-phosphate 3-epimerase n=1 Tax=Clostridium pasteurianum DSM 525 = ATCC 6013 TaxID=1262449 RepID=A0A0H3J530_CLOPA|nr:ribulose-phosphate 3-epimerase [Clostridium pasteurianum]AJA48167.1 ribulose-phosphate 3-epimerase [Clostridium pasteurianum DSM 525 = ATCC 6013]AJA52155.1 ribulose-phosphate 3-epimerase [Clostridium pasteurianum DSM 525 = ATCC 6013]AOZ75427.1 ribulose phosphate epimerase [Clostridium pasteurianum DSM 525 = ATCC 6013]AOZ79222.1 ribulose phosphate epimerase [Clostridium pasteurianum]ELP60681.1 ribulose-phosphate 3-epimerase [Clostridium pasteurianum DSM 525 = ATCC 6013]